MVQKLGFLYLVYVHATSILKSCLRFFKKISRTQSHVNIEYNEGHWNKILTEKKWKQFKTLEEYIYHGDNGKIVCLLKGEYVRMNRQDYYRARDRELADYVLRYLYEDGGTIVEIGSGTGRNLFALACMIPKAKFLGLDIADNGIKAGREIAEHFGMQDRFEFDRLDLIDGNHPNFKKLAGKKAFSFFCLEQIPTEISRVMNNILNSDLKSLAHIEPNTYHLNLLRPTDWANYIYIKSVDYQTDLPHCLATLQNEKKIKILEQKPVGFAPTVQNRGLLSVWTRV